MPKSFQGGEDAGDLATSRHGFFLRRQTPQTNRIRYRRPADDLYWATCNAVREFVLKGPACQAPEQFTSIALEGIVSGEIFREMA
jgi:hypothetical protein